MNTTFLSQLLAYLLPILGLILPGLFKSDGQTRSVNGAIAFVVILLVSGLQAFCAGQLGVNYYADLLAVSGGISGLLAGPLKDLDQYVQSNVGITSKSSLPQYPPVVGRTSDPTPIIFPKTDDKQ